jgi:UDP-3-O-[3-hydroxymyristoyl] glucosamine N-acyltransferase
MKTFKIKLTPEQIAAQLQATLLKRKDALLANVTDLAAADEQTICFLENEAYLEEARQSKAGLIFVPLSFDYNILPDSNLLLVQKPYLTFMMLVKGWLEMDALLFKPAIAISAQVSETAQIGENVSLGANVVIGNNVKIGAHTIIEANCVILENAQIGEHCHFYPNVTVYHDCILQDNIILHAGVVIGADGFGFILHEGKQEKIPQLGNVLIESDVEIGANSCVDRATLGITIIGRGTKIDNLVQVGHNVQIGEQTILCSQVGIAGSSKIGSVVYLAGQVGVGDHTIIGDQTLVGAQSGVTGKIPAGQKIFGTPAVDANLRKRIVAVEKHLPEMWRYLSPKLKEEEK